MKRVLNAAGNSKVEKTGEQNYFLARKWLLVISKEHLMLSGSIGVKKPNAKLGRG